MNLFTQHEYILPRQYDRTRAAAEQTVLHALAAAMALEKMPVTYAGQRESAPVVSAPLSFAQMDADAIAALQQSAEVLAIRCMDFQPEHWDILCSFRRLSLVGVSLNPADPLAQLASYQIQSMQLTSLRQLAFQTCSVSLQPVLQQLSALTRLEILQFRKCSEGLAVLSTGLPPLPRLSELTFMSCELTAVPPLRHVLGLQRLNLVDNPDLRDVQLGVHGLTSLTKLSMQDRTPVGRDTLDVLRQLPGLQEFHVCGHSWVPQNAALLGSLQHCSHAQQFELVV